MKSCMIVSPHPDDETLGAGGALLRLKSEGARMYWLNLTNVKEEYGWDKSRVLSRNKEISEVAKCYGFDEVINLELEPMGLDKYPLGKIVSLISEVFQKFKPETILLPWKADPHSDHVIAYKAVLSASKKFRNPYIKRILAMEIISETNFGDGEFQPNYFFNVSGFLDKKIEIMKIYGSELGDHPFPRSVESIRSLAVLRGSQSGCEYAESFRVIKWFE